MNEKAKSTDEVKYEKEIGRDGIECEHVGCLIAGEVKRTLNGAR